MRGQAHTLEGIAAAMLVIAGVSFALQATAVTPLSASTSNQHVENQLRATAGSLLDTAAENDTLRPTLTHWNNSSSGFVGTRDRAYFTEHGPPTPFGAALNETFVQQRVATNVRVNYMDVNQTRSSQRVVYMGEPSDNAVTATKTVVLYDDTVYNYTATNPAYANISEASAADDFYLPDASPDTELFNVVEVEVTVWRI